MWVGGEKGRGVDECQGSLLLSRRPPVGMLQRVEDPLRESPGKEQRCDRAGGCQPVTRSDWQYRYHTFRATSHCTEYGNHTLSSGSGVAAAKSTAPLTGTQ